MHEHRLPGHRDPDYAQTPEPGQRGGVELGTQVKKGARQGYLGLIDGKKPGNVW